MAGIASLFYNNIVKPEPSIVLAFINGSKFYNNIVKPEPKT